MNASLFATARSSDAFTPVRPGLRYGSTPLRKREDVQSTVLDRWVVRLRSRLTSRRVSLSDSWLIDIRQRIAALDTIPSNQYQVQFKNLTTSLRRKGHDLQSLDESLAYAAFAARNTLALTPHDVQLIAVRQLLQGRLVEMGTGEGKTLTMGLAAAVAALDGTPVHVLTASDYLAQRDATLLSPLYNAMGLSTAFVVPDMVDDNRRVAYQADVVHVTGKQVAFDWLRDSVARAKSTLPLTSRLGELVQSEHDFDVVSHEPLLRGLCMAIVDEADSLLIDEARTPLILAAPMADNKRKHEEYVVALTLARLLHEGVDFALSPGQRYVTLTARGIEALDKLATRVDGLWRAARYRNERVREALAVLHCWHRDRDYVVRDNHIQLVDSHTGRALPDRRLQQGLHSLLELKERCEPTPENDVIASLPFQHFFLNYVRLCGMSGTLREVSAELACVYGMDVVCVPARYPSQLLCLPARVFPSTGDQLDALLVEVKRCLRSKRPVLIGTRTVKQSDRVSALLDSKAIEHNLLNASQDANEAVVIEQAGLAAQVTVATNMAGRGTDIRLGSGVSESGGLHVIALAINDSYRLDRQLAGRSARQGDPGTFIRLLSLEDESLAKEVPAWLINGMSRLLAMWKREASDAVQPSLGSQCVKQSPNRVPQGSIAYRGSLLGMAIANNSALLLVHCVQRKIERKHATERQRALDASSRLSHHIAIGANSKYPT